MYPLTTEREYLAYIAEWRGRFIVEVIKINVYCIQKCGNDIEHLGSRKIIQTKECP